VVDILCREADHEVSLDLKEDHVVEAHPTEEAMDIIEAIVTIQNLVSVLAFSIYPKI